jgi:perosamine synthetase
MFGVIKRNPVLPIKDIFSLLGPCNAKSVVATDALCSYTGYSRFALYNILKLLAFDRGSQVLLPAYICDVLLLPCAELGLEPVYYGVTDKFQIDFGTVAISPKTKAIITVNYFGLSQNYDAIQSFAGEHDLVWLNDNSHGFASCDGNRKLESFGDFSFTSFRKVLPIINGARACVNSDRYASLRHELPKLNCPAAKERKLPRFMVATLLGHLRYRPMKFPDYSDISVHLDVEIMAFRFDQISAGILDATAEEYVQERRFGLYQAIDSFLQQKQYEFLDLLTGLLQPGNSPMVFPIVVRDRKCWKDILRASRNQGIDIHTWPSMPQEVIENDLFGSATRWQQLLFLPIHQDLDAKEYCPRLARVFDAIEF